MTPLQDWFHIYKPIVEGSMFMENDHALNIIAIDAIKLKMYDGLIHTILKVWYVKGLKKYILSMGQFDSLGCKIHLKNDIIKIFWKALMVLKAGKIGANLFLLIEETHYKVEVSISLSISVEETIMMPHQKLGHMLEKGLKILYDYKWLPGFTKISLPFMSIVLQIISICWSLAHHRLRVYAF